MTTIPRLLLAIELLVVFVSCGSEKAGPPADLRPLAAHYYGADSAWYQDNIPFFESSDKEIEAVYYYRWKLYRAHIRNVGHDAYVITEFINHVAWDKDPQCTINAASMHHIYEGRWLRDDRYINSYINYLYQQGGNNRRYSESIADAAWANFLVNADTASLIHHLDSMVAIYKAWADHFDSSKNMYYIPAMPDATEYTIASIDASGGTAGFDSGDAFRPTINSYMVGNAHAIARIANLANKKDTAYHFQQSARELQRLILQNLWNDSLQHFLDRYKQNNQFVRYWDFIRGRELAGFAPWYFHIPPDSPRYHQAWKHVTDTSHLLGRWGLRTNEPSYEYYFRQFVWYMGQRGSQWNGPSWPYQSSQVLTAMANVLSDYKQNVITTSDYLKILRHYAFQHYLPDGKINLVENYDPNLGGPIVYYYWSNHYLHSTFNNLVITGFCGLRPREDYKLEINPLIDSTVRYFYLDNVNYHGHNITVAYDRDGTRYGLGKGLMVWVDGKRKALKKEDGKQLVEAGKVIRQQPTKWPLNHALNITRTGYPTPSASINTLPDTSLYQAVDGRTWYFPEIINYWSTRGSKANIDWYGVDFGVEKKISSVKLYLFTDDKEFFVPENISIMYHDGQSWQPVSRDKMPSLHFTGNTVNAIPFEAVSTRSIRIFFEHPKGQVAVSEVEVF